MKTEQALVRSAFRRIKKLHPQCRREVPVLGRFVDLAFIAGEDVYTVEFKLRDWRRALKQARDHQLASDYAYICLPQMRSRTVLNSARELGVGIFVFRSGHDWPFECALEATRSTDVWKQAQQQLQLDLKAPMRR